MNKTQVCLVAIVCTLFLCIGINNLTNRHSPKEGTKVRSVKIHHLKDGRYYFRADDDSYWYYVPTNQDVFDWGNRLPPTGNWVRITTPPDEEIQEEGEFELDLTLDEDSGQPISEVESQATGDGTDTNSGAVEAAPAESAPSSDSGSDGGGDSGGGDGGE
jgi:hypothetical protein